MALAPAHVGYPDRKDSWLTGGFVARETKRERELHVRAHELDAPATGGLLATEALTWAMETWRVKMAQLMGDGKVRTFHRIVYDLTAGQLSASRAYVTAADDALWSLVRQRMLEHTQADPVLFRFMKAGVLEALSYGRQNG